VGVEVLPEVTTVVDHAVRAVVVQVIVLVEEDKNNLEA
jgi:hypothetical protein